MIGGYHKIALVALEGVPDDRCPGGLRRQPSRDAVISQSKITSDVRNERSTVPCVTRPVWVLAALGALAIHAGGVGAGARLYAARNGGRTILARQPSKSASN